MKKLCILVILAVLVAASLPAKEKLTPEEQAFVDRVTAIPLDFSVPREQGEEVWARIVYFFTRVSRSGNNLVFADYHIQSVPRSAGHELIVNRLPKGDEVSFSILCWVSPVFMDWRSVSKESERTAHILAYFAKTGEVIPVEMAKKFLTM